MARLLATAAFDRPAATWDPALAGTVAHHAFLTLDAGGAVAFASNPVELLLAP